MKQVSEEVKDRVRRDAYPPVTARLLEDTFQITDPIWRLVGDQIWLQIHEAQTKNS